MTGLINVMMSVFISIFYGITVPVFATSTADEDTLVFHSKVGEVRTEFTDREILAATYSDYRVPEGFYWDRMNDELSVGYVTSISIQPLETRKGPWRQLCTLNKDEARQWQQATDANSSEHRKLLREIETDKYFEFETERLSEPFYRHLMRVHKCSYIDRANYDHGARPYLQDFREWPQGIFAVRPLSLKNVRELGEYLWSIENHRVGGARVMSSFTSDHEKEIIHTMFTLRKTIHDQNVISHDSSGRVVQAKYRELADVSLVRLDYNINKKSGNITLDSKEMRTIRVRDNPPELITK